jgi:hypothetical protein
MPEFDRAVWLNVSRYCGKSRDFFVSIFPSETGALLRDYTMQALLTAIPELTTETLGVNKSSVAVREV